MELRTFSEPHQGATYDDLAHAALQAERLGFGAFFLLRPLLEGGYGLGVSGTDRRLDHVGGTRARNFDDSTLVLTLRQYSRTPSYDVECRNTPGGMIYFIRTPLSTNEE